MWAQIVSTWWDDIARPQLVADKNSWHYNVVYVRLMPATVVSEVHRLFKAKLGSDQTLLVKEPLSLHTKWAETA